MGDPEVGLGSIAKGMRVCSGGYNGRCTVVSRRGASQKNQIHSTDDDSIGRRNYASVGALLDKVVEVLDDQQHGASAEADRRRSPEPQSGPCGYVASPTVLLPSRVLRDGTHGITVNTRLSIQEQERAASACCN